MNGKLVDTNVIIRYIKDEDALEYIKKNSDYDVAHVFIAAEYTDKDVEMPHI